MKKCHGCGYENSDVMNYCLECGDDLPDTPQMVVPLDTIDMHGAEKPSELVTENYEKETVVNNRFGVQQSIPTSQAQQFQQSKSRSNTKLLLAIGGGIFAVMAFIVVAALGMVLYTMQEQTPEPSRPIVSKTPQKDDVPTPIPDDDLPPPPTPKVEDTPNTDTDTITFPAPTSPTKKGTYTVKNVSGWQLSEIKTVGSQNFRVRSSGRIDLDEIKDNVSSKGVNGYEDRRIYKEFRTGALLMRTHYPDGSHSIIQPVAAGEYWQNEPDEKGKIEFLINDNSPESNSGDFTVTVTNIASK